MVPSIRLQRLAVVFVVAILRAVVLLVQGGAVSSSSTPRTMSLWWWCWWRPIRSVRAWQVQRRHSTTVHPTLCGWCDRSANGYLQHRSSTIVLHSSHHRRDDTVTTITTAPRCVRWRGTRQGILVHNGHTCDRPAARSLLSSSSSSVPVLSSFSSSSSSSTALRSVSTRTSTTDPPPDLVVFADGSSTTSSTQNETSLVSNSLTDFASHVLVQQSHVAVQQVVQQILDDRRTNAIPNIPQRPSSLVANLTAQELIALGAVWYLHQSTPQHPSLGRKPIRLNATQSSMTLHVGDYLRIHHHPRRFPNVHRYDWSKFVVQPPDGNEKKAKTIHPNDTRPGVIVAQSIDQGWMVIDKPEHVPVHGTVDNAVENVAACVRTALVARQQSQDEGSDDDDNNNNRPKKEETNVYVSTPQRLDQNTSGLLVVATSKVFANYFATLLRNTTHQKLVLERRNNNSNPDASNATDIILSSLPTPNYNPEYAVRKLYRCLVCLMPPSSGSDGSDPFTAPPLDPWSVEHAVAQLREYVTAGTVVRHYLEPSIRAPKRFVVQPPPPQEEDGSASNPTQNWAECLLRMTNVSNVVYTLVGNAPGQRLAQQLWSESSLSSSPSRKPPLVQAVVELDIELLTGRTHQIRGQLSTMGYPLVGDAPYGGARTPLDADGTTAATSTSSSGQVDRLALQCCQLEFDDPDIVHHPQNDTITMIRSKRRNVFRLERAWWTGLLEQYQHQSSLLSTDQMTMPTAANNGAEPSPNDSVLDGTSNPNASGRVARPDLLPPRVSLSPGRNKYVLIRAVPPNEDQTDEWFVKSAAPQECGGPYHGNVAQELREWIEAAGYQAIVTGGGRIYYRPDESLAIVYGFSYGFGRGDHAHAASLIGQAGIDAMVDDSPELY